MTYEIRCVGPGDSTSSGTLDITREEALALFEQECATSNESNVKLYEDDELIKERRVHKLDDDDSLNWDEFTKHIDALRAMGCAVVTITPDDAASVLEEEMDAHEAHAWLRQNHDDVEGAILGEYWGESIHDLYNWKSKND
jgi:hypothetical protein